MVLRADRGVLIEMTSYEYCGGSLLRRCCDVYFNIVTVRLSFASLAFVASCSMPAVATSRGRCQTWKYSRKR